jgi:ABC-type bacteriocin/lantibiotic exporter with double-glycine peptidase domain
MVLVFHGRDHSEAELSKVFGTVPWLGTLPENVLSGLEQLGYHALWFENATLERLMNLSAHEWPIIAFLRAADLPHGAAGLHAVVVVEIRDGQLTCLDPNLDHELQLDFDTFFRAWSALGHQGIVLWF